MVQIISLGVGVQSTALYFMSSMGEIPRADYAIFSDTGKEGLGTYRYLNFLQQWKVNNRGIPIIVLRDKNLYDDLLNKAVQKRFVSIPSFTINPDGTVGMLRRQCTAEYKIRTIDNYIRDHIYHLPKGSRRPLTGVWQGITLDEIERMSIPQEVWKLKIYPFLGYTSHKKANAERLDWAIPMTREDVIQWYHRQGLPVPPKSGCVFCPYRSDQSWLKLKEHEPEDFLAAVAIDETIRDSASKGIINPTYLHRSCIPLAEVSFDVNHAEESGECSGNCHV